MEAIICYFFSFVAEAEILWIYSSALFEPKRKKRTRFVALCCFYTFLFSIALLRQEWLNVSLYLIFNFIFLYTMHDTKQFSAFFHSAILAAVMGMCELSVYSVMEHFSPQFFMEIEDIANTAIFAAFSKLTYFTIIYILSHFLSHRRIDENPRRKSVLLLTFIPVASVFIMITLIYIVEAYRLSLPLSLMIALSAILLLGINLFVFGVNQYNQKKSRELTELKLQLQKESDLAGYYEMLRAQNENQRILIHDIKKHLQSVAALNEQGAHDKISAYIDGLVRAPELKERSRLCTHALLNTILCRCMQQCGERGIAFHADIRSGTTEFIADNDVTALFCNLLDNAEKAAAQLPDAFIELSAVRREKTPFVVITVINSCAKDPFSADTKLLTRKPDSKNHGFGLKSIRRVVKKYSGSMQMYYSSDTAAFHTIILLRCP